MNTDTFDRGPSRNTTSVTSRSGAKSGASRSLTLRQSLWFVPVITLLSVVTLYPAVVVGWMSLQETRYFETLGFVGVSNYIALFKSAEFWQLTQNSMVFIVGTLTLALPLGLLAAIIVRALGRAGNIFRVALLIPWTLSQAVVGSFFLWLLNPSYGPIAYWSKEWGLDPGLMLGDFNIALPLMVCVAAWWSFPYAMIVVSASLQGVPKELFEALQVDGGGPLHALRYVIWPYVAPAMSSVGMTLAILYISLITLIIVLTGGGPLGATATWSFDIFRGTVQASNIAPASALSVVVLLSNLGLGLAYLKITKRVTA